MAPLSIPQFQDELPSHRGLPPVANDGLLLSTKGKFSPHSEEAQPTVPLKPQSESQIRILWARVLGVSPDTIEDHDDFFQCGGSTSDAIQLSRLMSEHGLLLTVRSIFQSPRLADLSTRAHFFADSPNPGLIPPFSLLKPSLDLPKIRTHAAHLCHVKESRVLDIFPCTPLQEGMLALTRSNSNDYVQRYIFEVDQSIDIGRLRLAWDKVVAMNPILRTRIITLPNCGIMQVVLDEGVQWIFESSLEKYQQQATPEELPMGLGDPLNQLAIVGGNKDEPRYLVWEIHHALFDGWSIPLILNDVEHVYHQETGPELLSMAPYIKYIREIDEIIAHRFWTDQFTGIQGTGFPWIGLSAYVDPSPNVLTTIVTQHVPDLDWGRSDFTPATIVRAAWALVMAIRAGTNEALYGVTVTGRQATVPGIERIVGPAIATVPVLVKVDWERSAYQFLESVQHQAADMIPFEQTGLQNIRHISEEAATACRFRSLLVIHPTPSDDPQFPERPFLNELARSSLESRDCNGRYTVDIDCRLTSNGIHTNMEFDTRLIPKSEMTRVVQDFENILRYLAGSVDGKGKLGDATTSISSFLLGEIADVLTWNSQVPEPVYGCVHTKIEEKALECPRSLAIHAWDGALEYQQLIEISTRLACQLVDMGVMGTLVPLLFEKSLWMPVAVLAVMKAGGILVALDMKQPKERLAQVVSQTNSPVLLCSEQNTALAQMLGRRQFVVGWNHYRLDTNGQQRVPDLPVVRPDNLLYVVFTSGSTGTPKGVRITHQNFCTAIAHQQKALGYSKQSRVIDFASYAFDVIWSNFFLTLTAGACLCIPSSQERENHLADCLTKYDINLMDSTPSLARALGRDALSKLITLILGGETILPSDVLLAGDHTQIINAYGPAECTPTALLSPLDATGVRIGRGVGVCTWIVEADNPHQLAPVGMVGELWLEGPLVGDGYLDDAERTAAAFVQDPIWLVQKAGRRGCIYRTGDLVRYEADGNVVFIGRKDHQVKIRGQRVELGEVETVIRQIIQQPTARVVVEAIQQTPEASSLTLVTFIALHGSQTMDEDSHNTAVQKITDGLTSRLEELLPSYMIPAVYFPLRDIPVMATGKTDRKRLRVVGKTLLLQARSSMLEKKENEKETNGDCKEQLNETQTILQNTWMSVLNLSQQEASVDVSFSRLGGDSISAMQVVSQCRMHNLHLTVSDILLSRTIRNLAKKCQVVSSQDSASAPDLEDPMSLFDLSPIQRNFFDTYPDGLNHYNQSFLLDLKDPVSVIALEAALYAIVSRHAILRARFEKDRTTNSWKQRIAEHGMKSFGFATHTMDDYASVGIAAQWRQENMDIRNGPVFACDLFNLPKGSQMLLLSAHHLVMDLVSWRIIWADLEDHLQSGNLRSSQTLSFRAWCAHQAQVGRTLSPLSVLPYSIPEPQLGFWGVPLEENTFGLCESVDVTFSQDVSSLLFGRSNDTLRTEGIDLILSALFHSFTHTFPERSAPAIWVEGHGREQPSKQPVDISGTVGWFTTLYPLAIPIKPDHSLARDIVRLVKDTRRKVPGNGQPFWACRYNSESGRLAFEAYDAPEVVFNFTGRFQQLEREDGLFDSSMPSETSDTLPMITENSKSARRPAMIDIEAGMSDGELKVEFIFHQKMNRGRLQKWIHSFTEDLELLSHKLAQASTGFTLSDLPLLTLSYKGLDILLDQKIPHMDIRPESVLDIYPCSPLQEGMLISAAKGAASYHTHTIYRCVSAGEAVCPLRLESAWKLVANRHTVLSSVFTLHPEGNGFIQIVLNEPPVRVMQIETDLDNPTTALIQMGTPSFSPNVPQHMLTICRSKTAGEVAFRLDMDHTMNDAHSMPILLEELAASYDGSKLLAAPLFVDIIRYISQTPRGQITATWAALLDGIKPCNFPTLPSSPGRMITESFGEISSSTPYSKANIMEYCKKSNILFSSFLQVAWAVTLSYHTGMEHVCFSYLTSGRDAPISGVERMVGPLANLLISRVDLGAPVREVLQATSKRSEQNMAIQNVFIAEVLHRLGLSGQRLFNTSLSIRYVDRAEIPKYQISFLTLDSEDGHEYDLSLSASANNKGYTDLLIEYREPYITRQVAQQVYETLNQAIDYLLAVDFDVNNEYCDVEGDSVVVNNYNATGSPSLFDQFFAQMCGVEKSIVECFWKDQFSGTRGGHFPEVKRPAASQIEHDEEVHLTTEGLDLSGGDFTVDVIVRAAWAILTARISHSDESLFGAGLLDGEEMKHMLPVRVVLDWDSSITHFLQTVEQQLCEMAPFQRMNLDQVSRISDEAAFICNFQTLIAIRPPEDEGESYHIISKTTNGDTKRFSDRRSQCAVIVNIDARGKEISISFDSRVVSANRALRLIHELEHVIHQLLDVNRQQNQLRSVTVASQHDLNNIWTWNSELPPTVEGCVHDLIIEKVIQRPHFTAINAWDGDLTYGELHELSSKLAHQLLAKGIGRGSIVPLCFEKSKWMPVAALAVMKVGAASVAMDTSFPEQRLCSIIAQVFGNSNSRLLLSSLPNKGLCERLDEGEVHVVGNDLLLPIATGMASSPQWPDVHPSDTFYVVFTSGTTGSAKGVMVSHQNFYSAIAYQGEFLGFDGNSRVLEFTSYAFDVFWLNLLRALAAGGCLCIPSLEEFENDLGGCLEKYQPTIADLTPSVARIVDPKSALSKLSTLVLGGEVISPSDLDLAGEDTQVILAYGPAECTPTSTILHGAKHLEGGEIGRGIGVCTWIVDLENPEALAAVGAVGELWVEGPLVGEGYLNDPERTARVFIHDPAWLQRGSPDGRHPGRRGRVYRTGDLVRYKEDGSLVFLGRRDTQVKIRGQRVELGDLEHHIRSTAVKIMEEVGTVASGNGGGNNNNVQVVAELVQLPGMADKTLAAFVALDSVSPENSHDNNDDGQQQQEEEYCGSLVQQTMAGIRKRLEELLPRYMLPSAYIPIRRIPIAATGKADRQKLREMAASLAVREVEALNRASSVDSQVPPQTEKEFLMQGLWAEVLKIEDQGRISASDSFFRIGGDSIAAMRLVAIARYKGLEFTVRDVFQHPVLRDLCLQCGELAA